MKKYLLITISFILSFNLSYAYYNPYIDVDGISYFIESETEVVAFCIRGNTIKDLIIPSEIEAEGNTYTVVKIANYFCESHEEIESIILPETVKSIGTGAFHNCTSLREIHLPQAL